MNNEKLTLRGTAVATMDERARVARMTTYTNLRETLRTVQTNYEALVREVDLLVTQEGRPITAEQRKDWAETCAEVARRVKDATP